MTTRRHAITPTKSPQLTGGDDRPEPACLGKSEPYDVLIEGTVGPLARVALREAVKLCRSCPIALQCFTENAEEPWVQAIKIGPKLASEPGGGRQEVAACGTDGGYYRHIRGTKTTPKTPPCKECRAAHAVVQTRSNRAKAARRKAAEVAA